MRKVISKRAPRADKIKIMLDSGAYSAWTRGEQIDLNEYIQFVKRFEPDLDTYINLDVIPGAKGTTPTVREVERAAAASFENYQAMVGAGLRPIPVFHYGENFGWLERLLEAGADYICLGGTVGMKTPTKRKFLDECFTILTNARGEPLVRVHGLGVTEAQFVVRYPWHSVDSTSWMIAPIYGNVLVPAPTSGSFSAQIWVGGGELANTNSSKKFENLPESAQQHVLDFARSCGCTITDLRHDVYSRMVVFVSTLLLMQKHVAVRFARRRGNFNFAVPRGDRKRCATDFRIIFAGQLNSYHQGILQKCGVNYHLCSYYEYKKDSGTFTRYLTQLNSATPYDVSTRPRAKHDWTSLNYHDHRRRKLAARAAAEETESEQDTTARQVG